MIFYIWGHNQQDFYFAAHMANGNSFTWLLWPFDILLFMCFIYFGFSISLISNSMRCSRLIFVSSSSSRVSPFFKDLS